MLAPAPAMPSLAQAEIQDELDRVLGSTHFAKAYRASALLRFLVGHGKEKRRGEMNEYAIGLAVFGRSAATYSTGADPIVRVHAGRLRERLRDYYASEGRDNPLRIAIPLGGYRPSVERSLGGGRAWRLAFRPLSCLSHDSLAQSFTLGLNEELRFRLHHDLGAQLASAGQPGAASHQLEGSVRMDGCRIRTALRLVDLSRDCLVWSEVLDHEFDATITRQEVLARACCEALAEHLSSS